MTDWTIDLAAQTATHRSGIVVELRVHPSDGLVGAIVGDSLRGSASGEHLQRLLSEAIDAYAAAANEDVLRRIEERLAKETDANERQFLADLLWSQRRFNADMRYAGRVFSSHLREMEVGVDGRVTFKG